MGRMFRIITEGGHDPEPVADRSGGGDIPYVEIGGPEGVVTSIAPPVARSVPAVAPPEPDDEFDPEPIAGPDPRVLSVSFHRFPKAGLRLLPTEVSADVVAYHHPDHPVTAEYRAVRDEIRRQFEEHGPRVVLFAAAAPSAGTTTVLLNFAVALTQEDGAKVLVVDANFARPSIARRLGVNETPGLAEILGQTVPLAWALQPTAIPGLHALTSGVFTERTEPGMGSDFPRLLAQLRQWFDWVLVDGGAWAEAVGRDGMGPATDAVYLVTRQPDIDRPEFAALRASVGASGGLLRGYITTRQ
jgi:Mrp family chromosome partitioning ATPase